MYSKIWFIVLCLFLASFLVGCAGKSEIGPTGTVKSEPTSELKTDLSTLAIYPFETAGKSKITGVEIANLLISELIDIQGIKIVEREELENILNELGLEMSDLADPSTRVEVGRLLGAQLLCFGSLNKKINLTTARVVQTETSEILFVSTARHKDEVKSVEELAQALKDKLKSSDLNIPKEPQPDPTLTDVEVTGLGKIIDGDVTAAKELALKDAYAKAIAQGAGVKLTRTTQVENFQLVRDEILTESAGYVAAYDILKENSNPPSYEVVVRASVSRQPISNVEKLQILVKYLHAKPRIAVLIDGEAKGESLPKSRVNVIQGQITSHLQQAGFSVVDVQTIEEKKKEFADSLNDEDAARLGSMLEANVTVRGSLSTSITGRVEELNGKKLNFPIITATTTGAFRVVHTDTADIIYAFSHEDLSQKATAKGYGTTDEAAISKSLDEFIKPSANQLIWGLAAKLGDPIQLRMELQDANPMQAEQFGDLIEKMPEQIVLASERLGYQEGVANYQVKTPSKKAFQKKVQSIDPTDVGANKLALVKSEFRTIVMKIYDDIPPDEGQTESDESNLNETVSSRDVQKEDLVKYTGIVVDASDLDVETGLYPKIYYRDGDAYKLLYGDKNANRPSEQVEFWVEWVQTLNDANSGVKDNPLIIQAISLEKGAIIISSEDAETINSLEEEYHFLEQGQVVIIYSE